jgi:hypothetical protein
MTASTLGLWKVLGSGGHDLSMDTDSMSHELVDRARSEALYASCHRAILGYVPRRVAQPEDGQTSSRRPSSWWGRTACARQPGSRGAASNGACERMRTELAVASTTYESGSRLREVIHALARLPLRAGRSSVEREPVGWASVGICRCASLRSVLVVAVVAFIAFAEPGGRIGSVHVGAQPVQALSHQREP